MVLAQIYKSKDFKRTLGYTSRTIRCLLNNPNDPEDELPQVIYGNVGTSLLPGQIAAFAIADQMSDRAELSHRVVRPCYHMVLSVPQQDTLDRRDWHDLTRDFLEGMGLRDRQAVAYLHEDTTYPDGTERPHVHIVANRVGRNGKAIDTSWDYYRAQSVLRELEEQYDLTPEPSSWEVDRRRDPSSQVQRLERLVQSGFQPDPTVRQQLQDEIDEVRHSQSQWPDVVNTLEQKDIDVRLDERGWSLAREGIAFAGSQLGSQYTAEAVRNALEMSMSQEDRDGSAIEEVSNQLQQPPNEDRDRPTTAEPQNVGSQMRQRLRKSLEDDNKQRAIDRDGLERGTSNLSNLGNQALKLAQGVDGTTMVGAALIGGSMALKAGQAIKEALDNHQDRKRQERVAKISDRIEKINDRAESLEEQVTAAAADLPAPTVVSTGPQDESQPDPSKDPVAGVLFGADSKIGDLEEALGLERGDSSLGIDPEKPFDEQLDQIEKSLESLENRLERVADRCLDVIDRESTSEVDPSSPTAENDSGGTPLYDNDLAQSIVNYAGGRATAYGISANDPIETRSLGTIQVDNDGRISISDDSYGTKFEAAWDDDQGQWLVEIDDLSDDERTSLCDLPQTPEEYSSQANGKATVQALRTLAQKEFEKPDGGTIRWEARQGNSYQVTIDNQSDGSQSVVGHNPDSDEEVLRATISPNGAMKIDQFNLDRETVDDLVNVADRQRRQRDHPANAILKKQTPTEDLAL